MTLEPSRDPSPRAIARWYAALFLVTVVAGITAQAFISERLIRFSDPAATAANILAHASLYRAGFTLYLIEMASQVVQTCLLYQLLRPVHRGVALAALTLGLVGCTIKLASRVFYLAPAYILGQPSFGAFSGDQLAALVTVLLRINDRGAGVALALFGFETVLEGWLIFRSTFLPRWLGVLTIVSGLGWLTWVSPTLGDATFMAVALLGLVASVATIGWFLVKGVDETRWLAQSRAESIWR